MANYGPASAWLLVGGIDVTGDVFDLQEVPEQVLEECHPFLGGGGSPVIDNWDIYFPAGMAKTSLDGGQGVYDTRVAGMLVALQNSGATRQMVSYGFGGTALGAYTVSIDGTYAAQFTKKATRGNITMAQAKHTITGSRYAGRLVAAYTARTGASGDTKAGPLDQNTTIYSPPAVVITSSNATDERVLTGQNHLLAASDKVVIAGHAGATPALNGNQTVLATPTATHFTMTGIDITVGGTGGSVRRVSSPGCVLDLQMVAYTAGGASNVIITAYHSDDASSWSTLQTFTAITGANVTERKVIAPGTQVKRYLALGWAFTGGGGGSSCLPMMSVYRT